MSVPKRRAFTLILGLAVVLALLLPSLRPRPVPRYTVTDLGILPGDTISSASGINNHGDIVGVSSKDYATTQIFLYHSGTLTNLGPVRNFGNGSETTINDSGKINQTRRIGSASGPQGTLFGGSRSVSVSISSLPGCWIATLRDANGRGQVIGTCWQRVFGKRSTWGGFLYDSKTGKFLALPVPPGFLSTEAEGINEHGQVAGWAWSGSDSQATVWSAGRPALLEPLPGRDQGVGKAINNEGDVVGSAAAVPGPAAAFVTSHNLRLHLLVPIFQKQYEDHAVLYKGGKAQDLNMLIPEDADWTLTEANSINDRGQIVGYGLHRGQRRAFLLTPR